jgi:hypothetical protein
MKRVIDLRPVYPRKEERIRAYVILCWLALLRPARRERLRQHLPGPARELDRAHVGTCTGPFRQRTEITKAQRGILRALKLDAPPRIYQIKPAVEP